VLGLDLIRGVEVGEGAGDLEDAVVGAGGEIEVVHRLLQQGVGLGFELAVLADELGGHGAVGGDSGVLGKTLLLDEPAALHPLADGLRILAAAIAARQLFVVHGRDFDVEVDAVEQRAGDPLAVFLDLAGGTAAFPFRVTEVTAGIRFPTQETPSMKKERFLITKQ